MKNRIIILLLIMFVSVCVWSQTPKDTLLASQYFATADSLLTEEKHDESIALFEKALPIYQKHKVWERVATCYNKISKNYEKTSNLSQMLNISRKVINIETGLLNKNSLQRAIAFDDIGYYYRIRAKDYYQSIESHEKALVINRSHFPKLSLKVAESYNNLGLAYRGLYDFDKALEYFYKSVDIKTKLLDAENHSLIVSYRHIGDILTSKGEYKSALKYLEKSKDIVEKIYGIYHLETAYTYFDLGLFYSKVGFYDQALEYYQKCLKIQESGLEKEPQNMAFTLGNIGGTLIYNNNFDIAIEYLKKAIILEKSSKRKNNIWIAAHTNNIGIAYRHKGNYPKALEYAQKALKIYLTVLDENSPRVSNCYQSMGIIYEETGEYTKAQKFLHKALNVRLKRYGKKSTRVAHTYNQLGTIYKSKKEYTKALQYFYKALDISTNLKVNNAIAIAESYNEIATIYVEKKEFINALKNYDKAKVANQKVNSFGEINSFSYSDRYLDAINYLGTLTGEAKVYEILFDKGQELIHLQNSISIYKQADALIQTMRQSFTNYQDKLTFSKTAKEVYEGAIAAQLALYEVKKDPQSLEQAFYYAEKSKANTLKELLTDANAKKFTGLPDDLIALEKELRIEKSFYKSRITEELSNAAVDSTKISTFENELFRVNRSQDSLIEVLEQHYPKYHELKYQNTIVTVADIQQQLNDQTTVVEFFTSDSTTYAFTISKEAIDVKSLQTKELTKKIEAFRSKVIEKDLQQYKQQAYELYTTLFKPILDQLKGDQLLIIPDGSLWHLNFDLLLTQKPTSNNPADLPYLLREYAISYGNSANLLFSENTTTSTDVSKLQECLAFSFSDSTQVVDAPTMSLATLRDTGDDLPGTRAEIRAISEIIDGEYYYGSQAIEKNFKDKASQYNILHLALHGEVDNEHPENSRLYFTKIKDTLEDNLLYSHELFAMDIPAALTVLSACNTGSGKIAKGEGIMSLGSAFQYAGSKSLLLTNWAVSDRTTPELIQYFYKNLKEGMNKSKALQQAKLTYIKEADIHSRDPFYWGSFYLVGDISAMHFEDNTLLYWMIGLGSIGLLFLILLWYRRKAKKTVN
ncbi:CHAT domain-containing protein [Aquimarina algicola]|uniref:Tetratricopeptide repeat protein n=1 Tax=Aquimarina algicola TaxID=2589995 RepID=A0A504J9I7_9FLAO|nr:CHAT domain-containing protein [Aquimarina algicola]TPN87537.1 tetratricopeptide repeat protein [Aquimarina algicola]